MSINFLEELTKAEGATKLFNMEFSRPLPSGATLDYVYEVSFTNTGRVEGSTDVTIVGGVTSGTEVQVSISGGTKYEQYLVSITVATSTGSILVGKGLLRIT